MLKILAAVTTSILVAHTVVADTVELVNGDLLHGTISGQNDRGVVIEHPVLGRIELGIDQVKAVLFSPVLTDVQTDSDAAAAAPATATSTGPVPGVPDVNRDTALDGVLPGWDKHLELGFTGSDGNSQTFNLNSGFIATKQDDYHRRKLDTSYFRNQDDGSRTRNEFAGELVSDWLMPDSPWFRFASAKLAYDEFQDWETRTSGFAGVGKQLREGPAWALIGRIGLGLSYEFGSVNELIPEALLGLESVHLINDQQKLSGHITVFPSLDDSGESRAIAGVAWTIRLDKEDGLNLRFGIDDEYESRTEGSAKHNDVKYYGALVFDF